MDGERISLERAEISAKRQRGAALQAEALRLFAESDEQARLLELRRLELPRRGVDERTPGRGYYEEDAPGYDEAS